MLTELITLAAQTPGIVAISKVANGFLWVVSIMRLIFQKWTKSLSSPELNASTKLVNSIAKWFVLRQMEFSSLCCFIQMLRIKSFFELTNLLPAATSC